MRVQAGIFSYTEGATDPEQHSSLRLAVTAFAQAETQEYQDRLVFLAQAAANSANGFDRDKQPVVSQTGVALTFDGRIDNRADLASQLGVPLEQVTDSLLMLGAYLNWGERCFANVIGDWATAIWDPRTETVLLARDYSGICPLYYQAKAEALIWSSELTIFRILNKERLKLNDQYILMSLVRDSDSESSPYSGVMSVPPGHVISIKNGYVARSCFWQPDPYARISYRRQSDYEEQFRALFRAAVRNRIRGVNTVWSELSGGLDSSAITCMADEIIRSGETTSERLVAVSYTFAESKSEDERAYMDEVTRRRQLSSEFLSEGEYSVFFPEFILSLPQAGAAGRLTQLRARMERDSVSLLLSGMCGDAIMWNFGTWAPHLADLASIKSARTLSRSIRAFSLSTKRTLWDIVWNDVLSHSRALLPDTIPRWVSHPQVEQLKQALEQDCRLIQDLPMSSNVCFKLVRDMVRVCAAQHFRNCGINAAYPFMDRQLLQFMLAVPFDQKLRPGVTRFLHRRALAGIVPETILGRQDKVGATESILRAIRREWSRIEKLLGRDCMVAELGYINLPLVQRSLHNAKEGRTTRLASLLRVMAVEIWLRSLESEPRNIQNTSHPSTAGNHSPFRADTGFAVTAR